MQELGADGTPWSRHMVHMAMRLILGKMIWAFGLNICIKGGIASIEYLVNIQSQLTSFLKPIPRTTLHMMKVPIFIARNQHNIVGYYTHARSKATWVSPWSHPNLVVEPSPCIPPPLDGAAWIEWLEQALTRHPKLTLNWPDIECRLLLTLYAGSRGQYAVVPLMALKPVMWARTLLFQGD